MQNGCQGVLYGPGRTKVRNSRLDFHITLRTFMGRAGQGEAGVLQRHEKFWAVGVP